MAADNKRGRKQSANAGRSRSPSVSKIVITDPDLTTGRLPLRILTDDSYTFLTEGEMQPAVPRDLTTAKDANINRPPVSLPASSLAAFRVTGILTVPGRRTCHVEVKSAGVTVKPVDFKFLAMPRRLRFSLDRRSISNSTGCTTCSNANRPFLLVFDASTGRPLWKGSIDPNICDAAIARLDIDIGVKKTIVTLSFKPDLHSTLYLARYHNTDWNHEFPISLKLDNAHGCRSWPKLIKVYNS